MVKTEQLFAQRKIRVLGTVAEKAEVKNLDSWATIHDSSKPFLLTYESKGLVVAINGGGELSQNHPAIKDGEELAKAITGKGG
ncbi:hypothetical protein KKI23_01120, partial [Patescibacteria group bacterium]|nr:hypothetical protein [Patescibacteria group bacterium]